MTDGVVDDRVPTILGSTAHRPFALPTGPWMMYQGWDALLFAHWQIPAEQLRPLVPRQLELDDYAGETWVSLVPFRMRGVRFRGTPQLGKLSNFPEINVRTYVQVDGEPGVFFFSLDTTSRALIAGARGWLNLPYFRASMAMRSGNRAARIRSGRLNAEAPANLLVEYRPTGSYSSPAGGSRDWFLTERYRVYSVLRDSTVLALDVHHLPWRIAAAEARFADNSMLSAAGLNHSPQPDLLHFSHRQSVVLWPPRRVL
jgi:uncharacterized protein YqjF (DUF2071 family)